MKHKSLSRRHFTNLLLSSGVCGVGWGMNAHAGETELDNLQRLLNGESSSSSDRTRRAYSNVTGKRYAVFCAQTHRRDFLTSIQERDRLYPFMYSSLDWSLQAASEYGNFDGIWFLAGSTLTRENVITLLSSLAEKTQPGDEILIYWNGHGGSGLPSINDSESDGYDEFLVVSDTVSGRIRETSITDDDFSELIAKFVDCRLMLIIEACHSGGLVARQESTSSTESHHPSERSMDGTDSRFSMDDFRLRPELLHSNTPFELQALRPDIRGERLSRRSPRMPQSNDQVVRGDSLQAAFGAQASFHASGTKSLDNKLNPQRFLFKIKSRAKDISGSQPQLAAIFACSEDEVAYAGFFINEEKEIYLNPLAYAYANLVLNTPADHVSHDGQVLFTEYCDYAKQIVGELIAQLKEQAPGEQLVQTPVVIDNTEGLFLRPPKQEEDS